jgi:glycosyltransferase involved in cell wall biosynthesis
VPGPEADRPRRMLFISAPFPPERVPEADHALHECLHLAQLGFEVHVLTTRRKGVAEPPALHVHAIMERWSWREVPRLWRLLRRLSPEVTMLWFLGWLYGYQPMITLAPVLSKLASRGSSFITQFSNLGSGGQPQDRIRRLLFRVLGRFRYGALLTHSDRFIVLSGLHQRRLAEMYPAVRNRVVVIPPPPLLRVVSHPDGEVRRRGRHRLGIDQDAFLITYFSRLYPGKGIEMLFEAFADVSSRHPEARLAMVGGYFSEEAWFTRASYPEELAAKLEELGITDRVAWSGEYRWDSTEPSEYLYASDVVVLPFDLGVYLYNSSFAAVLAHGLPVIATRGEVVEDPIVHGVNVLLIDPGDRRALVEAIEHLLEDEGARSRLRAGAQALAAEWFSWERASRKIAELVEPASPHPSVSGRGG